MEYGGMDLHTYISEIEGQPSDDTFRKIFSDILTGVEYLHGAGVVHQDIRLENIVITLDPEPCCKLIDYEYASPCNGVHGIFEGDPLYRAPEVRVEGYDMNSTDLKAVDMWAVGVTMYTLYFKRFPFSVPISEGAYPMWHDKENIPIVRLIIKLLTPDIADRMSYDKTILDIV